jgi:hypothetical protein
LLLGLEWNIDQGASENNKILDEQAVPKKGRKITYFDKDGQIVRVMKM